MGKIALNNINYIDIESGTEYLNKTIEIIDDKISSICNAIDYKVQDDTFCIDYNNCWAIPGIVDMHTHITLPYQLSEPEYYETPQKIIDTAKNNLLELRNAGITVCRDMGSYANSAEWVKCFFENDKSMPLILTCGNVLTYKQGHMCDFGVEITEKQSIVNFLRNNFRKGADFVKVASDPKDVEAFSRMPNPAFDIETIDAIVKHAKEMDMVVACHTYPSQEGVKRALFAGVRTIEHAAPFDESMGKESFPDVYYVPTFVAAVDDCGIDRLLDKKNIKNNILKASDKLNVNLSYATNIYYPTLAQLSPIYTVMDSLMVETGNPSLKSAVRHTISANLTFWDRLTIKPMFKFTPNRISEIYKESGYTGINYLAPKYILSYDNIDVKQYVLQMIYDQPIGQYFNMSHTFTYFYDRASFGGIKNSVRGFMLDSEIKYFNQKLNLGAQIGYYRSLEKSIQLQGHQMINLDSWLISLNKQFWNKKASVMLSYVPPITWGIRQTQKREVDTPFYSETYNLSLKPYQNMLLVRFNLRFNSGKTNRSNKQSTTEKEERMKRNFDF